MVLIQLSFFFATSPVQMSGVSFLVSILIDLKRGLLLAARRQCEGVGVRSSITGNAQGKSPGDATRRGSCQSGLMCPWWPLPAPLAWAGTHGTVSGHLYPLLPGQAHAPLVAASAPSHLGGLHVLQGSSGSRCLWVAYVQR